jgi:hypothetical protein
MLELLCSKSDFVAMYKDKFGSCGLSESTVLEFLKKHGVRNLCHHDCVCASCMAGTKHGMVLKELLTTLHTKCSQLREGAAAAAGTHESSAQHARHGAASCEATCEANASLDPSDAQPATPRASSAAAEPDVTSPLRPVRAGPRSQWTDKSVASDPQRPYDRWQPLPALSDLADAAVSHCRFGVSACCATRSDNCVHCPAHALSEDNGCCNETQSCEAAGHKHEMTCSKCNSVFHVLGYLEAMVTALEAHEPDPAQIAT